MIKVCLLLEGTYPYVTGGVSSFIHQLIEGTPDVSYTLVYIGATKNTFQEKKYTLPANVENVKEIFLFDYNLDLGTINLKKELPYQLVRNFIDALKSSQKEIPIDLFEEIYSSIFNSETRIIDPMQLFFNKESWNILNDFYYKFYPEHNLPPFIDYFYTWRFTHYPLFKILASELPMADIYHAMSTGYAGLLGAVGKLKYGRPLVISEHGIYVHEREIEITQSKWISDFDQEIYITNENKNFKRWWIENFKFMAKIAYHYADDVTTLFKGNQIKQWTYGAPKNKTHLIPNGINIQKFTTKKILTKKTFNIMLVGRVVPIKDIKTFIKAIYQVKQIHPFIHTYIVGPTDEDESYYQECITLARILNVDNCITFTGKANVLDYYPITDLLVLSSISEGQPLVILEAYCSNIPVLATDVGACREMILGDQDLDKDLGPSGAIVPLGPPESLAEKIIELINSPALLKAMGENARIRVEKFYQEVDMINGYKSFYQKHHGQIG